jgi:hypothetical protein
MTRQSIKPNPLDSVLIGVHAQDIVIARFLDTEPRRNRHAAAAGPT